MKIKELKRTVNVSWSPAEQHPVFLAAGSAAQQVDSSFSSSSHLELYSLNLEDPGLDLELKSSLQTQHKFQKVVWSGAGIIVGGCDGGLLEFYSADKLMKGAPDALIGDSTKHNGHVSALDVNPYQKNLLASGASESEIFIWDLNNTSQPMAPGNRSQPLDHVQALAWNQQVQHILGSTFATRCVVWDLRKNEPIMKLSDSQSRTRWRSLAWHPNVATQLCIASEDDLTPVIQLWDLRLAASPLVTLESHQKGVLSMSWCRQDPDLLLSAGKDGRVLCWNPNNTKPGGELLTEISQQQQWVFDVSWSPRDPGLLASSSFDQQVSVHSLLGGSRPELNTQNQNNIMDSFGGLDSFNQLPAVSRNVAAAPTTQPMLPQAPLWLKRPTGAKFAFGGKLVTFERCPQEAGPQKSVYISQVVSEPEIVERATELDAVLGSSLSQDPAATEQLAEYCRQKGDAATDQNERYTWFFLRANFLPSFRTEVLNLLGFKPDEMPSKFKSANAAPGENAQPDLSALSRGESTETEAELSTDTSTDLSDAHTLIERKLANLDLGPSVKNVTIPNGEDTTSMICRALVCGNLEEAVELCLEAERIPDALIIASLGSQELLNKVQKYHFNSTASDPVTLVTSSLLLSRWDQLVQASAPASWRDTLATLVTHCEDLPQYCEMLGDKLSKEKEPSLSEAATVCYLCAMSPDALMARWYKACTSVTQLASLTERALLLRRAAATRGRQLQSLGKLESVLNEYAMRLAAQGCLQSALNTLQGAAHSDLNDRLVTALGLNQQRRASHQPAVAAHAQSFTRARTHSGHTHAHAHAAQRSHLQQHDITNTYNTVQAPYEQSPWQQASVPAPTPAHNFTPAAAPAPPPHPAQPPRPGSVGSAQGGLTRSKYKVDPSVQSAPLYNQYSFNQPQYNNSQPQYGYNSPPPDYSSPGFTPINPAGVNGGYYTPVEPTAAAVPAPVSSKPVAPGWNDPPMMSANKPKDMSQTMGQHRFNHSDMSALHAGTRQWNHIIEHRRHLDEPKQEVQAQAPITHPLFGVEPPQHVPLHPQYPGQPQQYPQYPGHTELPPQYGQQYPGQPAPVQSYSQQSESAAPVAPPPAPAPAAPVQKGPVPAEHAVMQTVFDSLRAECSNRAANPQMKRKLEDVQKRLETLYDMLREYRLSESALSSLHTCVQCAQAGDYPQAAQVATALATGTDFAIVASFLPGLKGLLQLAQQLQVYLR